jgi:2-iminobutanoate/2-iminopropanoate deaminase
MNQMVTAESISPATGAYSQAVFVSTPANFLYISGQVAIAKDSTVPRDFVEQCELVWHNIIMILTAAGMSLKDVVKMQGYITNSLYRDTYREVRARMLGAARPASTLIVVPALGQPEWLVEIDAIAAQCP